MPTPVCFEVWLSTALVELFIRRMNLEAQGCLTTFARWAGRAAGADDGRAMGASDAAGWRWGSRRDSWRSRYKGRGASSAQDSGRRKRRCGTLSSPTVSPARPASATPALPPSWYRDPEHRMEVLREAPIFCQRGKPPTAIMSSLRNSLHRRNHKERSQLAHRSRLGILEKHKDYVLRARDYHSKKDRITRLRQKAAERNKDEFYYGMTRQKTEVCVSDHLSL